MPTRIAVLCAVFLALQSGAALADMYKCKARDGKVTYQSEPCPQSVTEERLRDSPGGPASGFTSGDAKNGWDPQRVQAMLDGCMRDAYDGGKRGWERSGDTRPFPESQARRAVEVHCKCVLRRITSMKHSEFAANPSGHILRIASDAANGGECKFEISLQ